MFYASEDLYDFFYGSFKDYPAEAERISNLIQAERPGTRRILDVACGTGRHLELLRREHGYEVEGLDIDPAMLEIARRRSPEAPLHLGDMCDFELATTFEAVVCLFSSIGYASSPERFRGASRSFRRHLVPGGLLVVEPWFTPEAVIDNGIFMQTAEDERLKVCRMGHTTVHGRISRLDFEYLVGTADGIERRSERHELALFTIEETIDALSDAGFAAEHRPEGYAKGSQGSRGLYVAHAL